MPIYVGNKRLVDCVIMDGGTRKDVKAIYQCGSDGVAHLVWQKAKPSPLITLSPDIYMPLNGDILDASGNNNNPAATQGSPVFNIQYGFDGRKCFYNGGIKSAIRLHQATAKQTNKLTFSVCVFYHLSIGSNYLGLIGGISGINRLWGGGYSIAQGYKGEPAGGLDNYQLRFNFYPGSDIHSEGNICCLPYGVWTHIVAVYDYDNRRAEYYFNGVKMVSDPTPVGDGPLEYNDTHGGWDQNIYLGRAYKEPANDAYWCGGIQDFAFWKRALSESEIQELIDWFQGNMLSTGTSDVISQGELCAQKNHLCIGGTVDWDNKTVVPNKVYVKDGDTINFTATNKYLIFDRSFSPDVGAGGRDKQKADTIDDPNIPWDKYYLKVHMENALLILAYKRYHNILPALLPLSKTDGIPLIYNKDGSGTAIDLSKLFSIYYNLADIGFMSQYILDITAFLPGMEAPVNFKISYTA